MGLPVTSQLMIGLEAFPGPPSLGEPHAPSTSPPLRRNACFCRGGDESLSCGPQDFVPEPQISTHEELQECAQSARVLTFPGCVLKDLGLKQRRFPS